MAEDLRERIARALYKQGAYCGNCSYDGWDSCAECRWTLLSYATAVLDVLGQERTEVERLREAVGGLTANVKRWRNRASAERLKRQRWRKRALAAEAEVKRLWKVEIDALWLARLACSSSWPMDMAQQVENAAERVRAAFSDSSATPSDE